MSVDWLTNNLYWTNGALKKIMVSRHDGRYQLTLHHTSVQQPTGIAVDPINRFIFSSCFSILQYLLNRFIFSSCFSTVQY